ncbi:MAG: class I SAM-dependent methyltransferase [Chloroflexi bacterium]|nr:class I SAM-dependent methyltransferase [Chloroflexota bacterium]
MIGKKAADPGTVRVVLALYQMLEEDDYIRTLKTYYVAGLERFGDAWQYADLVTAAYAAAEVIRPEAYLEIGVRRGRSMAAVALAAPTCRFVGFDRWTQNYAGMPNPGEEFVRSELARVGHRGEAEFISGNSHQTVPAYLDAHPDAYFDMITVDGDHSNLGAAQDIACVLPRLKVGGAMLFDDISHFKHTLVDVWRHYFANNPRFSAWEFPDLGYGVGVAIRRF